MHRSDGIRSSDSMDEVRVLMRRDGRESAVTSVSVRVVVKLS